MKSEVKLGKKCEPSSSINIWKCVRHFILSCLAIRKTPSPTSLQNLATPIQWMLPVGGQQVTLHCAYACLFETLEFECSKHQLSFLPKPFLQVPLVITITKSSEIICKQMQGECKKEWFP